MTDDGGNGRGADDESRDDTDDESSVGSDDREEREVAEDGQERQADFDDGGGRNDRSDDGEERNDRSDDGEERSDGSDEEDSCGGPDQPTGDAVSLSLDETLELLANFQRRRILGFLMDEADATATVDELVDHLVAQQAERTGERPGRDHVATTLHHVHLPRLADAGVVDYDARSQEVRYWRDDGLEEWYDCIRSREKR